MHSKGSVLSCRVNQRLGKRFYIVAVIMLMGAVALYLWPQNRGTLDPKNVQRGAPSSVNQSQRSVETVGRKDPAPSEVASGGGESGREFGNVPPRPELPWRSADPAFHRYHELASKVVLTDAERREMHRLLESAPLFQQAASILKDVSKPIESMPQVERRLFAIDYMVNVIGHEPRGKSDRVDQTIDLIASWPNPPAERSLSELKAQVGDRLELLQSILNLRPDRTQQLLTKLNPTRDYPLIRYILETTQAAQTERAAKESPDAQKTVSVF